MHKREETRRKLTQDSRLTDTALLLTLCPIWLSARVPVKSDRAIWHEHLDASALLWNIQQLITAARQEPLESSKVLAPRSAQTTNRSRERLPGKTRSELLVVEGTEDRVCIILHYSRLQCDGEN